MPRWTLPLCFLTATFAMSAFPSKANPSGHTVSPDQAPADIQASTDTQAPIRAEKALKAAPCLTLAFHTEFGDMQTFAALIKGAYQRAGICFQTKEYPLARAGQLLVRGEIDADILRTQPFIDAADGAVVAVPTPMFELRAIAVTLKKDSFMPRQLSDLKGRTVGIKIGNTWGIQEAERVGAISLKTQQNAQLYDLLRRGRVKIVLMDDMVLLLHRIAGKFDAQTFNVSQTLAQLPLYHVLHRRHAHLLPALDAELRRMREEGAISKMLADAVKRSQQPTSER